MMARKNDGTPLKNGCDYASVKYNVKLLVSGEGLSLKDAASASLDHAKRQGCNLAQIQQAAARIIKEGV
jgi:hypothetical protein